MPRCRKDDKLGDFAYRVFQIKFIVFESALLVVFILVLFKLLRGEMGW